MNFKADSKSPLKWTPDRQSDPNRLEGGEMVGYGADEQLWIFPKNYRGT
ncbi:hypothetical protein [Lyngbya sp. CCY1209]|jgi:hypothetical protein|nr:hypothetical protein [Lyngbya sp. CCY1209]MEB3884833.1 hypothetical protein [Lyngbya sp. CCY1209]